jgi:hypothetical protein
MSEEKRKMAGNVGVTKAKQWLAFRSDQANLTKN